jgi:hypothetical protein
MSLKDRELRNLVDRFVKLVRRDYQLAHQAAWSREHQRAFLIHRKSEFLKSQSEWLKGAQKLLNTHLRDANNSPNADEVKPKLVVCTTREEHTLWRAAKLQFWSMPPNEYVGRRKRILVFDGDYLMGIVGIASCIWGLSARDKWIGWSNLQKKEGKIHYVLDIYILGAIPPYNGNFRGSKLIATILASKEIRKIWYDFYGIEPVVFVTTTLFGHSAIFNKIRHKNRQLWQRIGFTQGAGTMHFTRETYETAKELVASLGLTVSNRFGAGPNWKLRLMRTALQAAGLDRKEFLRHGYQRGVYALELASNARDFLTGVIKKEDLKFYDYSLKELVESWKQANHPKIT